MLLLIAIGVLAASILVFTGIYTYESKGNQKVMLGVRD